jgi:hypothetical protein
MKKTGNGRFLGSPVLCCIEIPGGTGVAVTIR